MNERDSCSGNNQAHIGAGLTAMDAQAMDAQAKVARDRALWQHRSDGMRCKTCMWFARKAAAEPTQVMPQYSRRDEVGRCRRHAPSMGGYPVVFMADWCGDHRLDENRA